MKKSGAVSKTAPKTVTTQQWKRLYEAAATLKRLEPWRVLWDTDIVTLQLPDRKEPVFCSVMGRGGECYGIGVYPGYDSFSRLHRMMSEGWKSPPGMDAFEQRCLTCYYGDREEITPEDRAVMQELGLKFRGRNQWIFFRAMEPGYVPWFLDAEQAPILTTALEHLAMVCTDLARGDLSVDFEGGETLLHHYSTERDEWLSTAAPMPPIPILQSFICLTDELLVARLKKQKKVTARLELDSFYIPTPVQERREDVPHLPALTILADREDGLLIDQHMAGPDESPEDTILDMLIGFIQEDGRPSAIYVRDERMACILKETCQDIGVSLIVGEGMPVVDEFFGHMLGFME